MTLNELNDPTVPDKYILHFFDVKGVILHLSHGTTQPAVKISKLRNYRRFIPWTFRTQPWMFRTLTLVDSYPIPSRFVPYAWSICTLPLVDLYHVPIN